MTFGLLHPFQQQSFHVNGFHKILLLTAIYLRADNKASEMHIRKQGPVSQRPTKYRRLYAVKASSYWALSSHYKSVPLS